MICRNAFLMLVASSALACNSGSGTEQSPMLPANAAGHAGAAPSTPNTPSVTAGARGASSGASGNAGMNAVGGSAGTAGAGSGGMMAPPNMMMDGAMPDAGAMGSAGSDSGAGPPPQTATLDETKTLIPHASWTCGMPDGIPPPTMGNPVFEATLEIGAVHDIGLTQYGQRTQLDVKSGTLTGDKIKGTFLAGGLEYQLSLSNGAQEIEGINIVRASDGTSIYFRSCATAPGAGGQTRFVPDFEAPTASAYAFLNSGKLAGTRTWDEGAKKVTLALYDVSGVAAGADTVKVEEPSGVPDQSWECAVASGSKGAVIYMESVGISGAGVSVGASKRGTRNIIPITGGTFSGKLMGDVLVGGGDYQLLGDTFVLDARYTLHTSDDQLIIVRNCGPVGALVPVFEARADGPYAWLNANKWLSSDPGVTVGAVNLTIYERQ